MMISIIAAVDETNTIGWSNDLPWRLPPDLKRFKQITMGKPIIMGRKTHESLGRPLPGRKNIVITSDKNYIAPGCEVAHSIDQALKLAGEAEEVLVIGGGDIYKKYLKIAHRIYLTEIHNKQRSFWDTKFPDIDANKWKEIKRETRREKNLFPYSFVIFERK